MTKTEIRSTTNGLKFENQTYEDKTKMTKIEDLHRDGPQLW
jgi:hypothetical protein